MQRKEIKWKYLEECRTTGWLINSTKKDLRTTLKSRETLGCFLPTNCDSVNIFRAYYFTACKGIQDSLGFWIPHSVIWLPGTRFQSLSVELGPGFRIRQLKIFRIQDSLTKNSPYSGIRIPLNWANYIRVIIRLFSVNLLSYSIIIALTAFYLFSLI